MKGFRNTPRSSRPLVVDRWVLNQPLNEVLFFLSCEGPLLLILPRKMPWAAAWLYVYRVGDCQRQALPHRCWNRQLIILVEEVAVEVMLALLGLVKALVLLLLLVKSSSAS